MKQLVEQGIEKIEKGEPSVIKTKGFLERLNIEKEIKNLLTVEDNLIYFGEINGYKIEEKNGFYTVFAKKDNFKIMTVGKIQLNNFIFNLMKSKLGA